jgi:hypothetical protein
LPADGFPDFPTNNAAASFANGDPNCEITLTPWELNSDTVTFTAWINPSGGQQPFAGLIYIVGGPDGTGFNYTGTMDTNGNYTLGYTWDFDAATYNWNSGITPPPGQWSFVALVVSPTNATVYIINTNGTLVSTFTHDHAVEPFSAAPALGSFLTIQGREFNGSMDHVAIFNQAFNANQIATLYDTAAGIAPPVTLNAVVSGGNVVVTWNGGGQLLQAPSLAGPWTTNAAAASPYQVLPSTPHMFYRVLEK